MFTTLEGADSATSVLVTLVILCAFAQLSIAGDIDPVATPSLVCDCEDLDAADTSYNFECRENGVDSWMAKGRLLERNAHVLQEMGLSCNDLSQDIPLYSDGYFYKPGLGYYKLSTEPSSWDKAMKNCRAEGTNLAVINSDQEAKTLVHIFDQYPKIHENYWTNIQAWIGASDGNVEGHFVTIYGTTLQEEGWEEWEDGQPANRTDEEDCVSLFRTGKLNDNSCQNELPYFCEKKAILNKIVRALMEKNGNILIELNSNWEENQPLLIQKSSLTCKRANGPSLDDDYKPLDDLGFYKFHEKLRVWDDALRTCAREGANLVVINSDKEAEALKNILAQHPNISDIPAFNAQVWVGANDLQKEGTFVTLSGDLLEKVWAKWDEDEPNNNGKNGEHCVTFVRQGTLNDAPCDYELPFFCESRVKFIFP